MHSYLLGYYDNGIHRYIYILRYVICKFLGTYLDIPFHTLNKMHFIFRMHQMCTNLDVISFKWKTCLSTYFNLTKSMFWWHCVMTLIHSLSFIRNTVKLCTDPVGSFLYSCSLISQAAFVQLFLIFFPSTIVPYILQKNVIFILIFYNL